MSEDENVHLIQVIEPEKTVKDVIEVLLESGKIEDGFYLCDVGEIVRRFKEWKRIMPRVETFYAVKCNPHRIVLETLAALGTGFDCASKDEIGKILSLGVSPEKIIYAHPTKKLSHLRYAASVGVEQMTFDNEEELYKVKKILPNAKLVLRIKHDDPHAKFRLGVKFGAEVSEASHLLRTARKLNLNVIGVSFHVGSGNASDRTYGEAIADARRVFDVAAGLGYKLQLLDIGGGLPGDKGSSIREYGRIINAALKEHFPDNSVKVISEPGRYYVASAFTLVSQIHSKRILPSPNGGDDVRNYHSDVTVFNSFIRGLYDLYCNIVPVKNTGSAPEYPSTVWGGSCAGEDRVSPPTLMLPELEIGDWLQFEDMGAYSISLVTDFSGMELPNVHAIIATEEWKVLTESATKPLPKDKFVIGNDPENYFTGLNTPSRFITNYF